MSQPSLGRAYCFGLTKAKQKASDPMAMEHAKNELTLSLPELVLIAATRGILGVGIGLLISNRLSSEQRKAVGGALLGVGIFTTIPLGFEVFGGRLSVRKHKRPEQAA